MLILVVYCLFMATCVGVVLFCIVKMIDAFNEKKCSECAEYIQKAAKKCKHCGAIQPH